MMQLRVMSGIIPDTLGRGPIRVVFLRSRVLMLVVWPGVQIRNSVLVCAVACIVLNGARPTVRSQIARSVRI